MLCLEVAKSETNSHLFVKDKSIPSSYLDPKNELEDYMFDTGDSISIEFFPAKELSGVYEVDEEGEIFLPRLDETFVRGLTKSELKTLLQNRYAEFLINPEIKVRIAVFKSIRVLARGNLRNPGFYEFPAYQSVSTIKLKQGDNSELYEFMRTNIPGVYAVGDIRSKQIRQIATAVADGMIAAINANRD